MGYPGAGRRDGVGTVVNRASPADLRKALEVAYLYAKMGVNFVAVPVTNEAEGQALIDRALANLDQIEKECAKE